MPKRSTTLPNLIGFNKSNNVVMHRQLYEEIRTAILTGRIVAGARLPSTRELAGEIGISRNTVLTAFEQLYAEGYTESRSGSGTYVSRSLPDELLRTPTVALDRSVGTLNRRSFSNRGLVMTNAIKPIDGRHLPRPFRIGTPAVDEFPRKLWSKLTAHRWRNSSDKLLHYSNSGGYRPLRQAIAQYLKSVRAVCCEWEQIIIVSGSQEGLDLIARVLLDTGDLAWIEDPGYRGARAALISAGANLIPIPVDDEGLNVDFGIGHAAKPRLIYVTPSHQYPLGMTMSLARRLALLRYADEVGAWIIEDDYDSEFRYSGRPLASLQGLDRHGRVIYIGTFSKVLFPSLRLGYIVAPSDLVDGFSSARALLGQSPLIDQAVTADFIEQGHFARHLRTMRTLYAERQTVLVEAVKRQVKGLLDVVPNEAGMHLIGWLPEKIDAKNVARRALAEGVEVAPLSAFSTQWLKRGALRLGYTGFTPTEIRRGVNHLAKVLQSVTPES